ncbi:hypothetical protein J5I95_11080 [Candidatus Poribacteria bacterium]|nr:hypothetical protein [Candidatus Poribacteria bacterium]
MKQKSLLISLAGGILALLSIFLPWAKFDISSILYEDRTTEVITHSGFETDRFLATLTFVVALAILGISIYTLNQKTPWKSRKILLSSSGAGLLCVLLTLALFTQSMNSFIEKMSDIAFDESTNDFGRAMDFSFKEAFENAISLQFGGFGAAIGFIVAFIGAWSLPKSNLSMENRE